MEARLDTFASPVARKVVGHLAATAKPLIDAGLPLTVQELVKIERATGRSLQDE
ncbi:hypothetical protein [Streptomyces poriticola]|uniref:hypothetical protein n=1 Tax=Streptomyces poriticola TaxID=3120506 RepID=UPI002FCE3198